MFNEFVQFVKDAYKTNEFIPLHKPRFIGKEKKYLNECIDSTFISSVGELVNSLEMFKNCQIENIENAEWSADRVVNIPSNVII